MRTCSLWRSWEEQLCQILHENWNEKREWEKRRERERKGESEWKSIGIEKTMDWGRIIPIHQFIPLFCYFLRPLLQPGCLVFFSTSLFLSGSLSLSFSSSLPPFPALWDSINSGVQVSFIKIPVSQKNLKVEKTSSNDAIQISFKPKNFFLSLRFLSSFPSFFPLMSSIRDWKERERKLDDTVHGFSRKNVHRFFCEHFFCYSAIFLQPVNNSFKERKKDKESEREKDEERDWWRRFSNVHHVFSYPLLCDHFFFVHQLFSVNHSDTRREREKECVRERERRNNPLSEKRKKWVTVHPRID